MSMPEEQLEQAWIEIDELKKEIDGLKAKLKEVPWTISDESMAFHEFQERERPSIGERVAFLNGIHWAEKRIRERV